MHKFCLRLIAAYKWSIVVLEKSLSPQGHSKWNLDTRKPVPLLRLSPEPFTTSWALGLSPSSSWELEGTAGDPLQKLPSKCQAIHSNLQLPHRNSHRNSSWLLSSHPAAARPLTDPRTYAISKHVMLCKPSIGSSPRKLLEVEEAEASWEGRG